ncbi:MAG: SdrD B-like domain-containing protein, partial [Bacteroidota bacterium]
FDLDDDGLTSDILCENNQATTFNIQSVASLVSEKLVRGQLDTAFSKFPNFGCTIPGGDVDYQIFVRNQGTVPMTNIVMIDILPFVGDKGVIDSQDRLSRWRPNLASPLQVPAGVTVYYSTVDNPCRSDERIVDDGPPDCQTPNWTTTPPTQLADVQSFKLDFGSIVVAPGDELKVEWQMKAPVSTLDNVGNTSDTIAWNSFAFTANRVQPDGSIGNALLAAEPIKVGIRLETPKSGSYGNFVFHDDNQNGIQDAGELGIDNIQVSFYADNGDGIADPTADTLVRTTITADGGLYLFPEVTEGNYFAVFQLPPAHDLSPNDQGADDALDSDGTGTTLNDQPVAIMPVTRIDASENDLSWDLGIYQNNTAAVGDYVWHDVNRDGLQNESPNYGLNSIEVYLFDVDNNLIATTTTANDAFGNPGYYRFDDLQPMDYYLEFDIPDAFSVTTTDQNGTESDAGDSDVVLQADTTKARTSIFTLVGNQYDPNWDAGLTLPTGIMSLGNFVWRDEDNNGNFNPATESGINDVIVNLYEDSNADGLFTPNVDTYLRTTNTQTNGGNMGYYQFDNLEEGDYIVQITTQNFDIGAPLHQFNSSTGNGSAPDPDDDVNFDDNGDPFEGYGVVSQAVTLLLDSEPDNDEDTDVNSNLTVDFGFFPPCGLSITQFEQNECQNNATEDNDTDDYFTVIVNADYANGSQYEIVLNAGQANEQLIATADYGTPTTIGNDQIFVADGQQSYQITIRDADNPSCFQTINTVATSHCSGCPQPLCVPISFKK